MSQHSEAEVTQWGILQQRLTIAFMTVTWFFILLRIWTRTYVISNFGWDDATMIFAGVSTSLLLRAPCY